MSWLFATGHVVDAIIVLALLEWLALAVYHRRTGRGIAGRRLAGNIAAGLCLLLALRLALTGAAWWFIAAALFGALLAHLADLAQRIARPT